MRFTSPLAAFSVLWNLQTNPQEGIFRLELKKRTVRIKQYAHVFHFVMTLELQQTI